MADFPATFLDLLAEHVLFSTKNKQLKELQFYTEHSGILSKIHLPVESLFPEFVKSFLCSIEDQNPKKFSAFLGVNKAWRAALIRQLRKCSVCVFNIIEEESDSFDVFGSAIKKRPLVKLYRYPKDDLKSAKLYNGPFVFSMGFIRRLFLECGFRPKNVQHLKLGYPSCLGLRTDQMQLPIESTFSKFCSIFLNIDGSDQDSNEQAMRFDSLFVGFVKQDKNFDVASFKFLGMDSKSLKILFPSVPVLRNFLTRATNIVASTQTDRVSIRINIGDENDSITFRQILCDAPALKHFSQGVAHQIKSFCGKIYQNRLHTFAISCCLTRREISALKPNKSVDFLKAFHGRLLLLARLIMCDLGKREAADYESALNSNDENSSTRESDGHPLEAPANTDATTSSLSNSAAKGELDTPFLLVNELKIGLFFYVTPELLHLFERFRMAIDQKQPQGPQLLDPDFLMPFINAEITPIKFVRFGNITNSSVTAQSQASSSHSDSVGATRKSQMPFSTVSVAFGAWSYQGKRKSYSRIH